MRRTVDRTILIVEPDARTRAELCATLEGDGYTVIASSGCDDALAIINNRGRRKARVRPVTREA